MLSVRFGLVQGQKDLGGIDVDPTKGLYAFNEACERHFILMMLRAYGGRKAETAKALKVSRKCLWMKCRDLGITDEEIFKDVKDLKEVTEVTAS